MMRKIQTKWIIIFYSLIVAHFGSIGLVNSNSWSMKNESLPTKTICDDNDLPTQCRSIMVETRKRNEYDLLCENVLINEPMLRALKSAWKRCENLKKALSISIHVKASRRRQIVDNSFGAIGNLSHTITNLVRLIFFHVKGFDIDSVVKFRVDNLIFWTDFNLYKQNRLIKDCDGFTSRSQGSSIFQNAYKVRIYKAKNAICSLFFSNAKFDILEISTQFNSYVKKRVISFVEPENLLRNINSTIINLRILNCYGIDINSKILNAKIFSKTISFYLFCDLNSIQKETFQPFKNLKEITFNNEYFLNIARKQGIEWINELNSDLNVNMNDPNEYIKHVDRTIEIWIINTNFDNFDKINYVAASEKDFCLFARAPFNQMVFLQPTSLEINKIPPLSCTDIWMLQYNLIKEILPDNYLNVSAESIKNCRFEQRLKLCNKTKYTSRSQTDKHKFRMYDFMLISELAIIICSSLFALVAIYNNLKTIYVILNKANKKTMREKHYLYMTLHCGSNAFFCFIHLMSLMSECQYPIGFYCSSIRQIVAIQYFKIVGEYFNCFFRLLSNSTYLGFSLCRLSLIGENHGKLIVLMNKLRIKIYMAVCIFVSAGLGVCKALQFDINFYQYNLAFPLHFIQNRDQDKFHHSLMAIIITNGIYDLITYFLFVLIQLSVDILLIVKLRRTIREKVAKMRNMKSSQKEMEKEQKKNEESKRRTLFMVISSSLLNLITKVPSMITSFNDMRIFFRLTKKSANKYIMSIFSPFDTKFHFGHLCARDKSCLMFQQFGNSLYLLSACSAIYFLKKFDSNFKEAYETLFAKKSKSKQTNFNQVKKEKT